MRSRRRRRCRRRGRAKWVWACPPIRLSASNRVTRSRADSTIGRRQPGDAAADDGDGAPLGSFAFHIRYSERPRCAGWRYMRSGRFPACELPATSPWISADVGGDSPSSSAGALRGLMPAQPRREFELGAAAAHAVDRVVGMQAAQLAGDRVEVGDDVIAGHRRCAGRGVRRARGCAPPASSWVLRPNRP